MTDLNKKREELKKELEEIEKQIDVEVKKTSPTISEKLEEILELLKSLRRTYYPYPYKLYPIITDPPPWKYVESDHTWKYTIN